MRASPAICSFALLVLGATMAVAQESAPPIVPGELFAVAPAPVLDGVLAPVPQWRIAVPRHELPRSQALVPLYSWLVTLNAMDVRATYKGLSTGRAREANPLIKPFVRNKGAFVGVKAALTVSTIYFAEKTRRKHPKKVLAWMIATDAALAIIVAHNHKVARR